MTISSQGGERLRIWDAPTRIFHWAVVALVAAAWWTEKQRMLDWHRLIGYSLLALILFRLLWGVVGSTSTRFRSFLRGPPAVYAYVRREMFRRDAAHHPGHNPLGGWSVVALLLALLVQTMLGMFAVDVDGIESGPLSYLVSFDHGRLASRLHDLTFDLLLVLVGLHLAAVVFHLAYKRDDLIGPMIVGRRKWRGDPPPLRFAPLSLALVLLALCAAAVWALVRFAGQA